MKALVLKALREIGLETPNADSIVAFKLTDPALIFEYVHRIAQELRDQRDTVEDSRQSWLDLPEYKHVRVRPTDTLERFRLDTAALAAKIKSNGYRRVSDERMKRDKAELRERRKLDKQVAPLFATDPELTWDRAYEMVRRVLHSAARRQRKAAIKARWGRT